MMSEDIYQIETSIEGIKLIHKSLSDALDNWSGGDPQEQVELYTMRNNFYRIILEHRFESM